MGMVMVVALRAERPAYKGVRPTPCSLEIRTVPFRELRAVLGDAKERLPEGMVVEDARPKGIGVPAGHWARNRPGKAVRSRPTKGARRAAGKRGDAGYAINSLRVRRARFA